MINTLPINIDDLLHRRTVESERIEYKASWNPETVLHTLCAFANDFHNLGGGFMWSSAWRKNTARLNRCLKPTMPAAIF